MDDLSVSSDALLRADRLAAEQQHADALAAYVEAIDADGPTPAALRGAAAMLACLGRPAAAEQLLASPAAAEHAELTQERLRHARDTALPVFDAHRLVRFEAALDAARGADVVTAATPAAAVLALYDQPDDGGEAALRTVLDHAALLVRLGRIDDAAPLLDAVAELVVPGTVAFARTTAQRVLVFLVLEREREAGHCYAQATATVARAHGWGPIVEEHLAIVHDELSLVGGERDALELLEELRAAAGRAGDPRAEELVARMSARRRP
jgi:hypothetical protein